MINNISKTELEILKKKIKWRSRRSLLELDLILDRFVNSDMFMTLSESELTVYQTMLDWDDNYLLSLLCRQIVHSDLQVSAVIDLIMKG